MSGTLTGWVDAGFAVEDDHVALGGVRMRTAVGAGTGILAWSLSGIDDGAIDGLLTVAGEPATEATRHPNRTVAVDHVVVTSPDLDRTTEALAAFGVELRRRRDAGRKEQRFFRLGPVILELIGEPGEHGPGPAAFWGLALTVDDIDVTTALLGDHLGPVTDAVQPGRRIATLRHEALGIPVPIAFLSPNPPPSAPP
ncbi:MAG: VOC family protein [Acidimicrobiales bacterium]